MAYVPLPVSVYIPVKHSSIQMLGFQVLKYRWYSSCTRCRPLFAWVHQLAGRQRPQSSKTSSDAAGCRSEPRALRWAWRKAVWAPYCDIRSCQAKHVSPTLSEKISSNLESLDEWHNALILYQSIPCQQLLDLCIDCVARSLAV